MKHISLFIRPAVLFSLLLISCKPAEITQNEADIYHQGDIQEEVARLIVNMPADDKEEENWVNEQLVNFDNSAVSALSGMLSDPAVGSDLQARYALSSLADYAARPGAESERDEFESAILAELQKDYPFEVKAFLMEQLRVTASDTSVPVLEAFLTHEKLYNDALRVLLTIDSPAAVNSIRSALPASEGQHQIAIIKSLGELKDKESAGQLRELASSEEWPLARMSFFVLSENGEPGSAQLFEDAIATYDQFRKTEIISFYLNYADHLIDNGYTGQSDSITGFFLNGDYPQHIKSSALHIRFQAHGDAMLDELIKTAQASEDILAKSALNLGNRLEGSEVADVLIDGMESAPDSHKIHFIEALGNRRDISADSILRDHTGSSNGEIRLYALVALHQIHDEIDPEMAIEVLNKAETDQDILEVQNILLQLEPEKVVPVAATFIPEVTPRVKPVLIYLLDTYRSTEHKAVVMNELNSDDTEVRIAVYKYLGIAGDEADADMLVERMNDDISGDELLAIQSSLASVLNHTMEDVYRNERMEKYYNEGTDIQKARLIETIPHIEGIDYPAILESALEHSNEQIRSAAARTLSEWNNPGVLSLVVQAIPNASGEDQIALIKNFVQLLNRSDKNVAEKEKQVHNLLTEIEEDQHKILLLENIAENNELLALQTVSPYLKSESAEIRQASIHIVSSVLAPHFSEDSGLINLPDAVIAVLDEETRTKVENDIFKKLEERKNENQEMENEPEQVFGSLFNGENLDGWQVIGNHPDSWGVENGILYTDGAGSGWISTESRYDNFVIELEYRVPEGGNSGLFLRAPHEGNPAVEGLEIQILDDYADQYADLQPWQFTGSIYFEEAASKRVTKPAGEWQSLKVRAEGAEIQVTLNDALIVNTNLINYMENVQNHPGLLQRSGFIGLQNHGDRVEFRNITIQKIE